MRKNVGTILSGAKTIVFMAVMICFLFITLSCTVWGHGNTEHFDKVSQADDEEKILIQEIRSVMAENGYVNCGITMTKVFETENEWNYTVLLHHKLLNCLNETELSELQSQLEEVKFERTESRLSYQFLE